MPVLKARVDTEGSKSLSTQLIEKFILNNPHRPAAHVQVLFIYSNVWLFSIQTLMRNIYLFTLNSLIQNQQRDTT